MQSHFWLLALCLMVSLTVNAAGNSASVKTAQLVELLSDPDEDKLDCDSDIPVPGSATWKMCNLLATSRIPSAYITRLLAIIRGLEPHLFQPKSLISYLNFARLMGCAVMCLKSVLLFPMARDWQ